MGKDMKGPTQDYRWVKKRKMWEKHHYNLWQISEIEKDMKETTRECVTAELDGKRHERTYMRICDRFVRWGTWKDIQESLWQICYTGKDMEGHTWEFMTDLLDGERHERT